MPMKAVPAGKPAGRPSTITFGVPVLPPLVQAFHEAATGRVGMAIAAVDGAGSIPASMAHRGCITPRMASRSTGGRRYESGAGVAPQR
jgi:hypothetical protein